MNLRQYLQALKKVPTGVRSLADLIAFNDAHPELEEPPQFEDQSQLIEAEATEVNATFFQALAADRVLGSTQGIDFVLKKFKLDALLLPANGFTTVPAAIGTCELKFLIVLTVLQLDIPSVFYFDCLIGEFLTSLQ